MQKLRIHLEERGLTDENHFNMHVIGRMREVMRLLFLQIKGKLDARYGCFEIFGVDFLLDQDLNPRL